MNVKMLRMLPCMFGVLIEADALNTLVGGANRTLGAVDHLKTSTCQGQLHHSQLLNADICKCVDDNKYGKACDKPIEHFPYLPGGWGAVDNCLSFLATPTFQQRGIQIAERLSAESWLAPVNLIVELGSYRTPVIMHHTHLKPNMASVLVDPLTRFGDLPAEVTRRVDLLRADFSEVRDLLPTTTMENAILVLLGAGGCSPSPGMHAEGDVEWTRTLTDFAGLFKAVVIEGAYEECWDCKHCWVALRDRYVNTGEYQLWKTDHFDFSNLPLEQRSACYHPRRTMHTLRRASPTP